MKIVLLGPDGQVGWELQRALAPLGELIALPRSAADLARPEALAATVLALRPDAVVNAGAYTAVDQAEREPALAHSVNAAAPAALAQVMAGLGGWLLHFSTDYVFDGSGHQPRDETAATGPLNVYGHSKLAGEDLIRASGCRHLILRTSWVYGARGGNFARNMLRLAADRETLSVIDDQIGAPTGADLLADLSAHMLRRAATDAGASLSGTYHAAAAGETSWCGYARHVLQGAAMLGAVLRAGPECVQAVPSTAYATLAQRPLNSRLDSRKLRDTFGLTLPPWQSGVDRLLREILPAPLIGKP